MFYKKFLLLPVLAVVMLSVSACKDDENTVVTPPTPKSKISVVHASEFFNSPYCQQCSCHFIYTAKMC